MNGAEFAQQMFNGLSIASIYALVSVGITLIFGLTSLVNFAHGEFMLIGGYVAVSLAAVTGGSAALVALPAILAVVVIFVASERSLFRFTLKRPINGFLISLGLIIVFQSGIAEIWGASPLNLEPLVSSVFSVGDLRLSGQRLLTIAITLAIFASLFFYMTRTRQGLALRAAAMDRETAGLMGVPVPRFVTLVFLLGGLLGGVAGVLLASLFPLTPVLGSHFIVKGFAIALAGGLGNVAGALAASLVLGLGEALIAGFGFAAWTDVTAFLLMILILLVRPQGFFKGVEAPH